MLMKILVAGAALAMAATACPAAATIVATSPSADVATTPYTINLGSGGTLTFSDNTSAFEGSIGVQTSGSAEVFSTFGAPAYFQPFANNLFPSDQLGSFAAYASPGGIPYSLSDGTVGFEYTLGDGVHFGLANIGGTTVDRYFLDTTPGQNLSLAVPEPATWVMMLMGFAGLGAAMRRAGAVRGNLGV